MDDRLFLKVLGVMIVSMTGSYIIIPNGVGVIMGAFVGFVICRREQKKK